VNLIDAIVDAADAQGLRRRVAELEATIAQRDATIAELTQRLSVAQTMVDFYYELHADKPHRIENEREGR
jgi:hypothetical protein